MEENNVLALNKINSMTKYPSILTYHKLGERGRLQNSIQVPFKGSAILTEKIDGVNGRIILFPDGFYLIGSREELLYAKGDLIGNPQLGIVDTLKPIAEKLKPRLWLTTFYFEVFGGKTTKGSKQYTKDSTLMSARLFDVSFVQSSEQERIIGLSPEKIASWRDNGGQQFYPEDALEKLNLPLTPRIGIDSIPYDLEETYEWMKIKIKKTYVSLDSDASGNPEGIVIRTYYRSTIAKLRFEDYKRAIGGNA